MNYIENITLRLDMEGNYENGKLNGNGIVYDNEEIAITNFDALSSIYIEYCQEKSERALSIIDETDFEYSEEVSGLIIVDYPVIQPNVFAEGKFNKGKANGNQKVYHPLLSVSWPPQPALLPARLPGTSALRRLPLL